MRQSVSLNIYAQITSSIFEIDFNLQLVMIRFNIKIAGCLIFIRLRNRLKSGKYEIGKAKRILKIDEL